MEKFGFWTVEPGRGRYRQATCVCGTQRRVLIASLRGGKSKSCGCGNGIKRKRPDRFKHGMINSPAYVSWVEMRRRCRATHRAEYKDYGARGIGVCAEWQSDFSAFLRDMGERPEGHTLDRIDNSKGYSKENCAWSPAKVQQRNRRSNRTIEYNGRMMTIAEAADIAGISHALLRDRIMRGWTANEAMETSPLPQGQFRYPGKPGPKIGMKRAGERGKKIA